MTGRCSQFTVPRVARTPLPFLRPARYKAGVTKIPRPYLELLVVLAVVTSPYWLAIAAVLIWSAPPSVGMLIGAIIGGSFVFGIVRFVNRRVRSNPPRDAP
jgi:hypothetical protein